MAKKTVLIHELTKFRNLFVFMLLLLLGTTSANAEQIYEIIFKTAKSDSSISLGDNGNLSDIVEESSIDYVSFVGGSSNYISTKGIKLGTSSKTGTLTVKINNSYQGNIKSIGIVSAKYGSDTGTLTMYLNGATSAVKTGITPGQNYVHSFDSPTNVSEIKLTTSAKRAYITKIVLTTASSGPVDPTVSFENESVEVEVGSTMANTISKPEDLNVSYASSDENVATVDANGTVTGVTVGTATITASWAAVADKYNAGSKTFAVTVVPAKERLVFEKVKNANQLLAGNEYILVATEKNVAMGAQNGTYRNPVNVTITNDKVSFAEGEITILTLGGVRDAWTFLDSDGNYLGLTSSSNALHQIIDATSDGAKWTVTNDFMLTNNEYSDRTIKYNSGSPRFACYTSGQTDAVLFVKEGSAVDNKADVAFSFGETTEFEVALNKGFTAPTLNKGEYDGTVIFTSSEESVATVASDGTVTLKGVGTTIITASGEETTNFHTPKPASYTLTVVAAVYTVNSNVNNAEYGSVSQEGKVITATPNAGYRFATPAYTVNPTDAATVEQDGNEFTVTATADCTVTINFEAIPTHTVTFSINGVETTTDVLEGSAITHETPADIPGKTFVGWATTAIEGTTNESPTLVPLGTMGMTNVTYYAVFANVVPGTLVEETDVLTRETTGVENGSSSYTEWTDKSDKSSAVYAGQSAGGNDAIQLRSNNSNSGIVTTTSGGFARKIIVEWNSNTVSGRTLDIYGSNTEYSAATDLYGDKKGTKLGNIVYGTSTELTVTGDYAFVGLRSNSGAMYLSSVAVTWDNGGTPGSYSDYCTTVSLPTGDVAAPIVFHDSGEYEAGLSVPMYAQAGAKIYYTTDGSEPTTASTEYTGALTIENATTLKAIAVLDGVASAVVTREYTIKAAAAEIEAVDGYYSIKNNGNEKYINVAGRKTVTFVADGDEADKAGTVLKVKINTKGQVEELRSQGVDLPGYADRAMNYVPKFVKLIVDKLHAEGSGEILGEHGLDAIMQKFNDSFDYHLYVEKADAGYRIYGKTPSMKPVVDFYAENKDNVDYKLPQLEAFINSAIQKVLQKTGGRGASILTEFKLHDIWQKMGGTLTEPVKDDAASIAKFYEEVLSSEANVWNFAYQIAMIYWEPLIKHEKVQQNLDKLGDYAKYLEKVENIQPDFKYYIVGNTSGNGVDFISQGNIDIQNNAARTIWTLEPRADFKVTFDPENVKNGGTEYYATLYTDFGYELAEGMKAYKVTEVDSKDYAKLEEIGTQIPAQTPVLLMTTDLSKTTLTVKDGGDAVTGNLLVGPDYLINEYQIKTAQVEGLFNLAKDNMGEEFYNNYVKEYEHLMLRNAGTVNNKYFFGLEDDDMNLCTYKNESDEEDCVVRNLGNGEKRLGFYSNWKVEANKAFLVNEKFKPVKLTKIPDVNRDGLIDVNDVTATVDIILGKDSAVPYKFDHDAADVNNSNSIDVNDVTGIVDIVLGTKTIE